MLFNKIMQHDSCSTHIYRGFASLFIRLFTPNSSSSLFHLHFFYCRHNCGTKFIYVWWEILLSVVFLLYQGGGGGGGCWSPAKSQYSSTDSRALLLSYVLPSSIQKNCQHLFCIEWKNKLRLSRKETKTETDDRNNNKTPILIDKIP